MSLIGGQIQEDSGGEEDSSAGAISSSEIQIPISKTLDGLSERAEELEAELERSIYSDGKERARSVNEIDDILEEIVSTHEKIVWTKNNLLSVAGADSFEASVEGIAESLLDWAIASKKAREPEDCVLAHLQRMSLCPNYAATDAVRLLGLRGAPPRLSGSGLNMFFASTYDIEVEVEVEEFCTTGLFEVHRSSRDENIYRPTKRARNLGREVRRVFAARDYSLRRCRSFLVPFIETGGETSTLSDDRIFSGNSFFNHRHEVQKLREETRWQSEDGQVRSDGLEALTRLFLFGLALSRREVEEAIGAEDVDLLTRARFLRESPVTPFDVVGEVQVFPLSRSDLHVPPPPRRDRVPSDDDPPVYLFATDWPIESFRSTRNAVMAVGYDTLELSAVSAASPGARSGRLLDLCCGCGIQGLFAWCCASEDAGGGGGFDELVGVDVNQRACYFMSANMALNDIGRGGRPEDEGKTVHAVNGDLYEPIEGKGRFDVILSNPPFVAIPSCTVHHLQPALYAAGGIDGMAVLRRILLDCFEFLEFEAGANLLMVTEVPNVERSCELLRGCLPRKERDDARIRVTYVEDDVESVDDYAHEREVEAGNVVVSRDWKSPMLEKRINNRALVLISISRGRGDEMARLDKFVGESTKVEGDADEEDAFLTKDGIAFARASLLFR